MAVLNLINMGCALDLSIVKQNILRPVGLIVGFISQFTFMPLVSRDIFGNWLYDEFIIYIVPLGTVCIWCGYAPDQ